jgi:hypothetical protein
MTLGARFTLNIFLDANIGHFVWMLLQNSIMQMSGESVITEKLGGDFADLMRFVKYSLIILEKICDFCEGKISKIKFYLIIFEVKFCILS